MAAQFVDVCALITPIKVHGVIALRLCLRGPTVQHGMKVSLTELSTVDICAIPQPVSQYSLYDKLLHICISSGVAHSQWFLKVVFISKVLIASIEANGYLLPFVPNATVLFLGTLMILFSKYFQGMAAAVWSL